MGLLRSSRSGCARAQRMGDTAMSAASAEDYAAGELHVAGETVPAGLYRRLDTGQTLCLVQDDSLPASLDGRVACYVRVVATWDQHIHRKAA